MGKRSLLLVNRKARRGRELVAQAIDLLSDQGLTLVIEPIPHPGALSDMIRKYQDQVELVIVGGGDGTLNAAIEGLLDTQLPLGILPLGTANDLARTLGIPTTLPEACKIIADGQIQRIDLGWVNGKHFFNVASLGLSVQITRQLNKDPKLKRWLGPLAYAKTALQVLWRLRPFHAEIQIGDCITSVKTLQIAVGNGRYYGGGMAIARDAAINDQRLDIYSLEVQHWWQILTLLPALPAIHQGNHEPLSQVRCLQAQEVKIRTRRPRRINTDGELTVHTPAVFRVIPQALPVLMPSQQT